jgi:alpha-1,2-mannosyltransferase
MSGVGHQVQSVLSPPARRTGRPPLATRQGPGAAGAPPTDRYDCVSLTGISATSARAQPLDDAAAQPGAPGRRSGGPAARLGPVGSVVLAATALGLALRIYQLMRPGYLLGVTEYDDAVDFGSAVRLVHGALPYRDFVLVQPPGISLLMAPVALLANITGSATGFAVARVLTACAGAASITLAGLLVRHRGTLVTTLTCGLLAVYPGAVEAAHTVLLEPWVVLFCLIGAVVIFDGDQITTRASRLAWGGAAFGFAGAIKVWAALPVLIILVLCWRRLAWRSWFAYLGGVLAGFAIPVLPFVAIAPHAFYQSVVVAQLSRVDVTRVLIWKRLVSLSGLSDLPAISRPGAFAAAGLIAGFVSVCLAAAWVRTRRSPPDLERFAIGGAVVVLAAFLWPADYYPHYAAFFAPFMAMSIALPAGRLIADRREPSSVEPRRTRARLLAAGLSTAAAVAFLVMADIQAHHEAKLRAGDPAASADRQIPAGACVVTDISALTMVADRFTSNVAGCSPMIDAIGTDYALSGGRNGVSGAGRNPAVARVWLSAFRHAQYVWIACAPPASRRCNPWTNRRIPWTPPILSYFSSHFRPLHGTVFVRDRA